MPVLTASPIHRQVLASRWNANGALVVISLCAAWCHTCGEFREAFERIAAERGDVQFVWLDIEDDHEICGDIDVEASDACRVPWRRSGPFRRVDTAGGDGDAIDR